MKARWLSAALVLLLSALTAMAALAWRPSRHMADEQGRPDLEQLFPRQFGPWQEDRSMPVVLPAPDVQAKLDTIYNQVLSRAYVGPAGARIMLSVAYGGDQSDGTRLHRPEVCYPAQGFALHSSVGGKLILGSGQGLPVRRLESQLGARAEPITYWVLVGDQVVTSAREQKLVQLRYGVRGLIPDGLLVRVSSINADSAQAFGHHERFVQDLARSLGQAQYGRVFGRAGDGA